MIGKKTRLVESDKDLHVKILSIFKIEGAKIIQKLEIIFFFQFFEHFWSNFQSYQMKSFAKLWNLNRKRNWKFKVDWNSLKNYKIRFFINLMTPSIFRLNNMNIWAMQLFIADVNFFSNLIKICNLSLKYHSPFNFESRPLDFFKVAKIDFRAKKKSNLIRKFSNFCTWKNFTSKWRNWEKLQLLAMFISSSNQHFKKHTTFDPSCSYYPI